jgi:D-hydroxyproline dehydrogenase subunit beta
MTDVAVVGAGIVGAACALACAQRGLSVTVYERGGLVAGTTGSGEGNILVSDKAPGPELDLALHSNDLWRQWEPLLDRQVPGGIELERKGGLIVSRTGPVDPGTLGTALDADGVRELEPEISPEVVGGAYFPQDMQVQPARAAVAMLAAARELGAVIRLRTPVDDLAALRAGAVVNATGAWAGAPVEPRRGFILVTEAMRVRIRHKVYSADYLDNVASDDASLQTSTVVEGTPAGPVLIGATRERVGFDTAVNSRAVRRLAQGAIAVFPFLAGVRIIRSYFGFRPFSPDHLPVIGPDPVTPGLYHAYGHEGAGIGLAPATGDLISALIMGTPTALDASAYRPDRFPCGVLR